MWVYEKKINEKERVCVCTFFYVCFWIIKSRRQKEKKNLMFWFVHGQGL